MKTKQILLAILLSGLSGCIKREFDLPLSPSDFREKETTPEYVILQWNYQSDDIDGFHIDRQPEGESWEIDYSGEIDKNTFEFKDSDVMPGYYTYKLYAKKGDIKSHELTVDVRIEQYPGL